MEASSTLRLLLMRHSPDEASQLVARMEAVGVSVSATRLETESALFRAIEEDWDVIIFNKEFND